MNLVQLFTLVGLLLGCVVGYGRTRRVSHALLGGLIGAVIGIGLLMLYVYSGLLGG